MSDLVHCIYASAATRLFDKRELTKLLDTARRNNEARKLTGMLLYTEGSFFQVLEGDPDIVNTLYTRIAADPRHDQVTKILFEAIPKRAFGDWTMGFSTASRQELTGIVCVNDFFTGSHCFLSMDPGRAKKLLGAFRDGRWHKNSMRVPVAAA